MGEREGKEMDGERVRSLMGSDRRSERQRAACMRLTC